MSPWKSNEAEQEGEDAIPEAMDGAALGGGMAQPGSSKARELGREKGGGLGSLEWRGRSPKAVLNGLS